MAMAGSVALMKLLDATLVAFVVHGADVFGSAGGVVSWCRVNGISRATFYRHLARVRQDGSWQPLSRRPRRSPRATPAPVVEAILRLRRTLGPDNGAVTIHYHLGQDRQLAGTAIPCPATIHKILRRAGQVTAQPRKRPKSSWRRFSYARPRDCYQIDATIVALADGAKVVVFEVRDDATRTLVATRAALSENAADAVTAIKTAFTDFGVPALVLSDNGSAFTTRLTNGGTSRFTRAVTDAGARLIHSSPYHPQTCGKVERHHRTFKDWLVTQQPPATLAGLAARPQPRRTAAAAPATRRRGPHPHRHRSRHHPLRGQHHHLRRKAPRRTTPHHRPRRSPRHRLRRRRDTHRSLGPRPHQEAPGPTHPGRLRC